jgi:hypothetical protein
VRQRFSIGASYELPGAQLSNSFARRGLGGWTLSGLSVLQTGTPFSVYTGAPFAAQLPAGLPATPANLTFAPGSGDYNADGDNFDFPNVTSYKQSHNRKDYGKGLGVLGTCAGGVLPCGDFALPAIGTEGNETPNQFRNPGYADVDVSLKKVTSITERIKFEVRLDTFNLFNRVNLYPVGADSGNNPCPSNSSSCGNNLQNGVFGQSQNNYPARNMLVGGRIVF